MHYPKLELLEKYKDEAEICKEIEQQKQHAEKHDGSKKERPLTASSDDYWTERPSRKNSWAIISVAGKSSLLKLSG